MTKYPRRDEARVGPAMQHYFETGELPRREAERPGAMDVWRLVGDPRRMAAVWEAARAYLLPDWVLEHAGARPAAWWTHDAPNWTEDIPARLRERARQADWTFRQPRRRMGGTGEPDYACLNIAPTFRCGVPRYFLDPWLARYYRGEALNADGRPVGAEYRGHHFPYQWYDPADPPRFEWQASYLQRHGLFLPGEEARLPADAFEPELVVFDEAIEP